MPRQSKKEVAWAKACLAYPIPPFPLHNGRMFSSDPAHRAAVKEFFKATHDQHDEFDRLMNPLPTSFVRRTAAARATDKRITRSQAAAAKKIEKEKKDAIPDPLLPSEMKSGAEFPRRIITRACTRKLKEVTEEREKCGRKVKGITKYADGSWGPVYLGRGKWKE